MLRYCILGLWSLFVVVWVGAAFTARATVKKESPLSRLRYVAIAACGGVFLQPGLIPIPALDARFASGDAWAVTSVALTAAGIGFAFWARYTLGKNWSGTVTIKKDHELVQTGPYALSRHPIYTGALVAIVGTVLSVGTYRVLFAVPFAFLAFFFKLRIEERFMTTHFGKAYVDYTQRVKRLIPFVW